MQSKTKLIAVVLSLLSVLGNFSGCKKEDHFLEAKPNQALTVPTSLADLQLLLNNESVFNRYYPALGETSTDDIYLDPSIWLSDNDVDKNTYVWAKTIYPAGASINDWDMPYSAVFNTNIILSYLPKLKSTGSQSQYNTIQGSALFFRSVAFYNLLQIFSTPYNSSSAADDLGIPIVLEANLNLKQQRATQSKCYSQIIADLQSAADLLSDLPATKTAPSKAAAYALLARTYLTMSDYQNALRYSTAALQLYNTLQDFNKLNPAARPMYPSFSPEELFHAAAVGYTSNGRNVQASSNLYALFKDPNDLRSVIYFRTSAGLVYFNAQFDRKSYLTYSFSTNELYLTKAECEARLNNVNAALDDLNKLLVTRWKTGTFDPYTAADQQSALDIILNERRKELCFTSLRWNDLRRLNKDPRYAITLTRNINGQSYTLPPNDPRYALPIPDDEIQANPMPQNPR